MTPGITRLSLEMVAKPTGEVTVTLYDGLRDYQAVLTEPIAAPLDLGVLVGAMIERWGTGARNPAFPKASVPT